VALSAQEAKLILRQTPSFMRPEKPGYSDGVSVRALRELGKRMLLPQPPRVVYPGSSVDTGVAEVFGKENVTHIDTHEAAMAVMALGGYEAVAGPVDDYAGDPFDLMVVRSALVLSEELIEDLITTTGYLISNNWFRGTVPLMEQDRLRLVAAHSDGSLDGTSYGSRPAGRRLAEHLEHEAIYGPAYSGNLFLYQKRS
jgi:hypothetical protein